MQKSPGSISGISKSQTAFQEDLDVLSISRLVAKNATFFFCNLILVHSEYLERGQESSIVTGMYFDNSQYNSTEPGIYNGNEPGSLEA